MAQLPKAAVLVDAAFYLHHHRRYEPQRGGDPVAAADDLWRHCLRHLQPRDRDRGDQPRPISDLCQLYRIFVYDCPPLSIKHQHPVSKRPVDFSRTDVAGFRRAFHEALKTKRSVALRLGYLDGANGRWRVRDPKRERRLLAGELPAAQLAEEDVYFHTAQKGVDMRIGLDIATLAFKRQVDRIILIAGDSDFVPAAKLARREGIHFVLDPLFKTIRSDLQEHIDALRTPLPRKGGTQAAPLSPPARPDDSGRSA